MEDKLKPVFVWPELLMHPNIPKPMHGLNPRTLLGQEWWDAQRQLAYRKNNFCCWACGVHRSQAKHHKWLEAHECYEIDYGKGRIEMKLIVALCHLCHNSIHSGRLNMLLGAGKITQSFYDEVKEHEAHVLSNIHGLVPELEFLRITLSNRMKAQTTSDFAEWDSWRLILEGKEYKPLFTSYEHWRDHYSMYNE